MARATMNFRTLALADETAMAIGNHASPDSMTDVLAQNGGTITYETEDKSFEMNGNATNSVAQMRRTTGFPVGSCAFEGEMNPRPHPGGTIRICELRSTDTGSVAARLNLKADGRLELMDSANGLKWTSTNPVPTTEPWRWRLARAKGTTNTNGTLIAAVYHGSDGKNTTADSSYSATNINAGITDLTEVRFGYTSATAVGSGLMLSWRNIQIETNSTAVIGPLTEPGSPPVPVLTKLIRREFDLSTSSGTPAPTLQSVTQLSGPAITLNTNLAAKTFNFVDTLGRTAPIVLRAVLNNSSGSVNYDITVPPTVKRIGSLYRLGGVLR